MNIQNIHRTILISFLLSISTISFGQLTASFFTNPAISNGEINICQGSTVLFTMSPSSQTNITSNTTIQWSFSGGNISTSSSQGTIPVKFSSNGSATLVVYEGSNIDTMVVSINVSTPPFIPTLSLSPSLTNFSTSLVNAVAVFKNCSSINYTLNLNLDQILNCTNVSSININWGLGPSVNYLCGGIPATLIKNYGGPGNYFITYRVNFLNGCSYYGYYQVQIGNGQINLSTSASNFACSPGEYQLSFDQQFPGNTYSINWGDNTTSSISYPNLPVSPLTVNHNYLPSTCTGSSPGGYPIQITSTNSCGTSSSSPAPIYISNAPTPQITQSIPDNTVCVGTTITFTDSSIPGININSTTSCTYTYNRYWFTSGINAPNTLTGTIGTYGSNGSSALTFGFNQPGTYSISLVLYNNSCEPDTITKTICVVPPVNAAFSIPSSLLCSPYTLTPVNTSSTPTCNISNAFSWTVTATNPQNCITNGGPSFSPATSTLQNPSFNLNGPGVYSIKLKLNLSPSVYGSQCAIDTMIQTITIKDKPDISLSNLSAICLGSSFTPISIVNSCYSQSPLAYTWDFNPNNTISAGNIPTPSSYTSLLSGSVLYPNYGTFPYTFSATNECGTSIKTNNISVVPNSTIPGVASSNQTICSSSYVNDILLTGSSGNIQWQKSTNQIAWSNINGANSSILSSSQIGLVNSTSYYRAILTSSCSTDTSNVVTITLNTISGTISGNQVKCYGSQPDNIVLSGFTGNIQWQKSTNLTAWTNIGSSSSTLLGSQIGNLNSYLTVYIRAVLTSSAPCNQIFYTNNISISVFEIPIAGNVSSNQYICQGVNPSTLILSGSNGNLQWQKSSDNVIWQNISGATTTSLTNSLIGSLNTGYNYFRVFASTGCGTVYSNSIFINVIVNGSAGIANSNQTICYGSQPNNLLLNGSSGSIQWQKSTNNVSWADITGATNPTLTSTQMGSLSVNTYYRAKLTEWPCSSLYSNVVLITINPTSISGSISANQTTCSDNPPTDITLNGSVGSIQWMKSTDNIIWNDIVNSTNNTLTIPEMGILNSVNYFRAKVLSGVCLVVYSDISTITINQSPINGTASSNQSICNGSQPNDIILSGYLGTIQWQKSTNLSTWTNIAGANSSILTSSQIGFLTTTSYYRAVVSTINCPSVNSNFITINVNPTTIAGISSGNQTLCEGVVPSNITISGQTGSIQWYKSTDNINWNIIASANSTTLLGSLIGPLYSTSFFRATVTSGNCLSLTSNVITKTINQNAIGGTASSNQTICSGTSPSNLSLFGYTGNIQWQVSTNLTTWSNITSATSATLTSAQMGTLTATRYYRAYVTNSNCLTSYSNTITISISPLSVAGSISSSQTICYNSSPSPLVLSGNNGIVQWQYSNDNINFVNITGATQSNLSSNEMGNLITTTYYRCIIQSGACPSINTNSILITITPASIGGIVNSDQTICTGTSPSNLTLTGNVGSIQWEVSSNNVNWSIISGANSSTLTSLQMGTLSSTKFYRAKVTNGICSPSYSSIAIVTIAALSSAGTISNSQSVCYGNFPNNITLSNYTGTIQWQISSNQINWTNINTATNSVLDASLIGQVTATKYFRAIVTSSPCSSTTSSIVTLTMLNLPNVNAGNDFSICLGTSLILNATGANTYTWNNNIINNVSFIPSNTLTYVVTGVSTNGCSNTDNVTITVNPLPTCQILYSGIPQICQNQSFLFDSQTNTGNSFQWMLNGINLVNQTNNYLNATQQGNYSLKVLNSNNCSITSSSVYLTVLPIPTIDAGSNVSICLNDTVILNATGSNNYNWSNGLLNGQNFIPDTTTTLIVSTIGNNGCSNSDDFTVTVNYPSQNELFVSTIGDFELNGTIYNESGVYYQTIQNINGCDSNIILNLNHYSSSITNNNNVNFNIYPNPSFDGIYYLKTNDILNIEKLNIYDFTGKLIKQQNEFEFIDLSEKSEGAYILEIKINHLNYYIRLMKK